jgi:hypothetical protein
MLGSEFTFVSMKPLKLHHDPLSAPAARRKTVEAV